MNYPLISEYIEAIKAAEDNLKELTNLRTVLGDDGQPVMTSGNFAVVFKMKDEETGKLYALKCFTKEQQGREEAYHQIAEELKNVDSPYLVSLRYLEKELFVDTEQTDETEFPVLLVDWVEGKTLDKYLRENLDDKFALETLAYRFSRLAQWLIPQPFAHGDLKPDNILVREDGTLVLVDYDSMYVPAMKGLKARELGSPDFRHPLRTENDFDEHIDDFPLVTILLSLKAVSIQPIFLEQYGASNRLLFSEKDYRSINKCELLKELFSSSDSELNILVSLFVLSFKKLYLSDVSPTLLNLTNPQIHMIENLSTKVTKENVLNARIDEFGFSYSYDKTKLLYGPTEIFIPYKINDYTIREGTLVICERAFDRGLADSLNYSNIIIPETITHIGDFAFGCQDYVETITIPSSVVHIGKNPFTGCKNLKEINCLSAYFVFFNDILYSRDRKNLICCRSKCKEIKISESVETIGDSAFEYCNSIEAVYLPDSVMQIGSAAFWGCQKLTKIVITNSHTDIGYCAFENCCSLTEILIPRGTRCFYEKQFPGLESLINEVAKL